MSRVSSRLSLFSLAVILGTVPVQADILWEPEMQLSSQQVGDSFGTTPALAVGPNDALAVVWSSSTNEIYLKRYDGVWEPEKRVTFAPGMSYRPAVVLRENGELFLAWIDDRANPGYSDLYAKRWDGVWEPDERLTLYGAETPALAADTSGVHLVYTDDQPGYPGDLAYRRWQGSWSPPTFMPAYNIQFFPDLAVDVNAILHLVWYDASPPPVHISYKQHREGAWSADERVSSPLWPVAYRSAVASDPLGRVHVVWQEYRTGIHQIYYRRREGNVWTPQELLSNSPFHGVSTDVAADSLGNVHVVWQDARDGRYEIYYRRWEGGAWLTEERLSSGPTYNSETPSIVCDGSGKLHVVWFDRQDNQLHYRRGIPYAAGVTAPERPLGVLAVSFAPNPFAHEGTFRITTPNEAATLRLYDVSGRLIQTFRSTGAEDRARVIWNGKDARGSPVPAGVYVYRMAAGTATATGRLIRVR